MPAYLYKAKRGSLEKVSGVLEAESRQGALQKLSLEGLFPLSLEESGGPRWNWRLLNRISKKEVAFLTRQLADLLESNIPLPRALELATEQTARPAMRRLIQSVKEDIRGGESLSAAMGKFPRVFSPLYLSLVYAGETGEMLPAALSRLAAFMEQEEEFRSRLLAALAYPLFIAGIGAATVIFLMAFVVPRLAVMFVDTGQGLPFIARFLSSASGLVMSWPALALGVIALAALVWIYVQKPQAMKAFTDRALFNLPGWGAVLKKEMLSRFARTLAMLLAGGVPIVAALRVVSRVMNYPLFRDGVQQVANDIEQGESLSGSLKRQGLFPVFLCQMIAIGEETNQLEKSLEKVAVAYERETDRAMKLAASLLEPLMIVGVGSVIGVIVIGMLLPVFQISAFVK